MSEIKAVVKSEPKEMEFIPIGARDPIKLSVAIVRRFLAPKTKSGAEASDSDCMKFIMLCKVRGLDPWQGDAFLQGYDGKDGPQFSLITAHQAFLKRAEINEKFEGMTSGVIVKTVDGLQEQEGDFVMDGDILVGGWAKVFKTGLKLPIYKRLKLSTFNNGRSRWQSDPAGMIVKCAEADALRTAFPTSMGAMYMAEEMQTVVDVGPKQAPVFIPAPSDDAPRVVTGTDETVTAPESPGEIRAAIEAKEPRYSARESDASRAYGKLRDILAQEDATVEQLVAVMVDFPTWKPYAEGVTTVESIPIEAVEMMVKNHKALRLALADAKKAGAA